MTEKNLYQVEEGEARKLEEIGTNGMIHIPETDGINSIIVAANNKNRALRIAKLYDAGKIGYDNINIAGHTYSAVYDHAEHSCDHTWNEGMETSGYESLLNQTDRCDLCGMTRITISEGHDDETPEIKYYLRGKEIEDETEE